MTAKDLKSGHFYKDSNTPAIYGSIAALMQQCEISI